MEKQWFECKKCGYAYDLSDGAVSATDGNGKKYIYYCKTCYRPKARKKQNKYYSTEKGRLKIKELNKNSNKKFPEKYKARYLLNWAVKKGEVIKPNICSKCGGSKPRIEAHHTDYSRPLDVIWLCSPCHRIT